jgi:autotransporter-associated beta strand protein
VVATSQSTPGGPISGRWANYSSGVVASTTTAFTGDFGGATAGTNVLFNPSVAGTVSNGATNNQLATVVFEPAVAGVTYDIGASRQINTLGVMLSGDKDVTVTNGSIFSTATAGTRSIVVLNPSTSLRTSSNLAASNNPVTTGGRGFLILTGGSNQVGFSTSQNLNVGGGTLRVTSTNFDLTTAGAPTLRLRGGTVEYDVSASSFVFNRPLGTAAGNVNWTTSAGGSVTSNAGDGGFSAYAGSGNGNGNTLSVNIQSGATLVWNDSSTGQLFLTDGYALKFGSTKSNATVTWQNPIDLNTPTYGSHIAREIRVTRGVGNSADRARMTGQISGASTSVDLLKTGDGVLELTSGNTYSGNTLVVGGTLLANNSSGSATGFGAVSVTAGATLGGSGIISGPVTIGGASAGTIAPGNSAGLLTLGGGLTLNSNATTEIEFDGSEAIPVETGDGGTKFDLLSVTGAVTAGGNLNVVVPGGLASVRYYQAYTITTAGSVGGSFAKLNGLVASSQYRGSHPWYDVTVNAASIQITFVPEPTSLSLLAFAGMMGRRRRK